MQFTTFVMSLALALSASAAPFAVDDATIPPTSDANVLQKRDSLSCTRKGPAFDRKELLQKIDAWCAGNYGWEMQPGTNKMDSISMANGATMRIGVEAINGCTWTIDQWCGGKLREPVDHCNTEGENGKQGGSYEDQCARWHLKFI